MVGDGNDSTSDASDAERRRSEAMRAFGFDSGREPLSGLIGALRGLDPLDRPVPPSRRRPRRDDVVTYRVRVEISGTKPPLWRRLELASDLFLNEVHDILQTVFGWQDYHLHRFASGPGYFGGDDECYLCPFEVDEDEVGVPEDQVRLDEVLSGVGDCLFYVYDFGDHWEHVLTLQAVLPRAEEAPRAVCTAGKRPAPTEDCGGVWGYEFLVAATDPGHPHHAEALAEYRDAYGEESDPRGFAPTQFDMDATNASLNALFAKLPEHLPQPLADLVAAARDPATKRRLHQLIGQAGLSEPTEIDTADAARMVHPYAWLLDHVGTEGIKLTGAGYLPPASVEAIAAELDLGQEWIGKLNREAQTLPVLLLRESAQAMGLLRKYKGKLLLAPAGRKVHGDPQALWHHLAERLPIKPKNECERQAGLLALLAVAAETTDGLPAIADILNGIGWRLDGYDPLTPGDAFRVSRDTIDVLTRISAATTSRWPVELRPLPHGPTFARAALRSWPM
ncbi:plasmid pRiA4b ORF-3 family protein [Nocardiopsis rhodophaea]|uniref:plasmid pRiA4b ORF-3 family protein n=1 Tax=Nocardiopsis rhodophaea TaxID=280238 RepID=UPI0031DC85F8